MSDKLDVTIGISADASGVEAGVGKAKKSIKTLGDSAKGMWDKFRSNGKQAEEVWEDFSSGANRSAKDVERATRSMQQQLQRQIAELNAGGKATREYTEALARMRGVDTRALAPLLDQLDLARKKTDEATKATGGLASGLGGLKTVAATALAGLSVGAFVSEITAITKETAKAAAEIERFSALSNTSAQEFQRLAAGAYTVGISAEKMADIFKDVQDKVGDFVQTGGGGMADFFERVAPKVGVTAENFRKLSGKDALQLYVSSLEKANLAHSDMVFFMEAIASDSSLLLPLLKDQGQAWQDLGDKAEAYGAVMDGQALAAAKAFKTESDNLELSLKGLRIELAEGLLPSMTQFVAVLSDPSTRSALSDLAGWIGDVAVSAVELSSVIGGAGVWGWLQTGNIEAKDAAKEIEILEKQIASVKKDLAAHENHTFAAYFSDDIAIANSQLSTMEAKLRGLQVMAQQYQAQQTAAQNRKLDQENAWWTKNYKSRAPAQESVLSPAFVKPSQKSSALKAEESAYKSLAKSIAEMLAQQNLEITTGEKLTSAQKLRLNVEQEVVKSKQAGLLAQIDEIEAGEAWLKNQTDVNKALADMQRAREQSLKSVQDSVRQLLEEAEAAAYAETHNISLAEAVERLALARAENAYQQAVERQEAPATLDALEAELQARKKIVELTAQKGVREANQKAQDQIAKDWERVSQTIGDTLADYIMGGGKDAAQYLKRLFATLVLQPVVNYGANTAMGALGMGQAGTAVGSVLGGNNVGTTILNNAGAIGAGFQAMYGMSVGASSASLAAANAVGMVGGDALGTLIAGNGAWAGVAVEAGATAGAAAGAAAAEGAAAGVAGAAQAGGFMSGVAAAAPWVAGAAALYSIAKSFDDSGTPHTGAGAIYKDGAVSGGKSIFNGANFDFGAKWSEKAQSSVTAIAGGLGSSLDGFAKAFGKEAGYTVATAFADDSSGDGAWGSLKIADARGNVLTDWNATRTSSWAPKEFADGEEGYKQYLTAIASDVKSAFMAMDLPAWADNLLAAATDLDTLNAALSQIAANKAGFDALASSMSMFKGISEELQTQLLATSGSMDALASVAGSYYGSSLFSEQERMLSARQQQMDALAAMGLSIDPAQGEQAKAAFRSTVEQAMAAGQGELAVKLMAMSSSFAQVADYAQQAMADAADAARQAQQGLMQSAAQVLAAMPGGADEARSVQSRLLAEQAAQIWGQGAEQLQGIILQSSAADIEGYLREAWSYLDTTEAKQALVDLGGQLLEFASQADQAAAQQRGAALAGAWGTLASISGLAAQYTGNAAGLNAQLAVMQGSYATADNPADRLAALQEVIALEQSIWGLQQKQRQSEAQAIQEGIKAAQEQLTAQQNLLRAAQSLGEFASDLFSSEQSGLSTAERQAALQSDYQMLLARAQGGDADAIGQLQGVSRDYLQLAQKTASSEADYSVLSGMVAAQLASVSAIGQASATSQTQRLEDQIKRSQQQADALSAAQFAVSDQTRVAIESLLTESISGFDDQLRSMQDLSDLTEQQLTALKQWPAALNGIMSATLVPSIQGIAQSASSSAVSAYVAANAAAEEQRMRRAAELVADQLRQQLAAAQAAAEAAAKAAIASASVAGAGVDGSHANGLSYVPFDNYRANLHKGERVLTASENRIYSMPMQMVQMQPQSSQELERKVERLEAQIARVANATEHLADMFENASAGGNAMAVEVMRMPASLVETV